MNRKHFIKTTAAVIAGSMLPAKNFGTTYHRARYIIPPYLQNGDVIGITSPAGVITLEDIQPAVQLLSAWGFKIKIGDSIGKKDFCFGGTDEERRNDFQQMLDDKTVKAILCARGGYGAVRIIDDLNWSVFKKNPKWIIGFSDITVILNHVHTNLHTAAIHAKMCNSFPNDMATAEAAQRDSILSIQKALTGITMEYAAPANTNNKTGKTKGVLVGGNLSIIQHLSGTASDIHTENKILFVEDTGEYLYSIDRMFWNLKRTGKLSKLKGLIIGGFKIKPDDPGEEFGRTLEQIVLEKTAEYNYPVCFGFPVGHQRANYALKCGVMHELNITENGTTLTSLA